MYHSVSFSKSAIVQDIREYVGLSDVKIATYVVFNNKQNVMWSIFRSAIIFQADLTKAEVLWRLLKAVHKKSRPSADLAILQ